MGMAHRTYYQMLGITPCTDARTLQKAYRQRVRQVHPDINPSAQALEQFYDLQRAYEALANPKSRAGYDLMLGVPAPEQAIIGTYAVEPPRPIRVRRPM